MKREHIGLRAFLNAIATVLYVAAVAWFLSNAEHWFKNEGFLVPLCILLLFVISATVTGLLVLGRPVQMYIDGVKREGIRMLFITLGWLVACALIVLIFLAFR